MARFPKPLLSDDETDDNTPADPLDELQGFLSGASPRASASLSVGGALTPYPQSSGGPAMRNNAVVGALRKKYGLDAGTPDVSQSDLEDLDKMFRGNDVSDKIATEVAPIRVQGRNALDLESARGGDALNLENLKGQYGLKTEAMKGQSAKDIAHIKESPFGGGGGAPGGAGGDMVDYWAQQAQHDSSLLSKLPTQVKEAVAARMAQNGGTIETPTNQQKQMSETANDLLDVIDRAGGWQGISGMAQNLQQKGLFNPFTGWLRREAAQHGMGKALGVDDQTASDVGNFNDVTDLLKSGLARAHAGARGAGNTDMAARFDKLLGGIGDFPTFSGQLQGIKTLLEQYASHTNPKYRQMISPANDPYASPDYQPR